MKQILLVFLCTCATSIFAQTSGEIIFEEKINLHRRLTGERSQFKDMVPEFMTNKMVLYFNETECLFKKAPGEESEVDEEVDMSRRGGRMMRFRRMRNNQEVYINFEEHSRIESREMMDKAFLIVDEPESFPWKLTGESMEVGDYVAHKASLEPDSTTTVVAWFTPQIPIPAGPGKYGQLPGMILHIDINDGERTMTAVEINLKEIEADVLMKPTKGKKVSQEEFDILMKERREEFEKMRGSRGPMMRRH
jgi:GLPGLI family protein